MSLEKIVQEAMAGRPLEMKEAFEEEMEARIMAALEEKYKKAMKEEDDDDEDDEDEDDEDEDEDDDDEKTESFSVADLEALIEEMDDETYAEFVEEFGPLDEISMDLAKKVMKARNDRGAMIRQAAHDIHRTHRNGLPLNVKIGAGDRHLSHEIMKGAFKHFDKADKTKAIIKKRDPDHYLKKDFWKTK